MKTSEEKKRILRMIYLNTVSIIDNSKLFINNFDIDTGDITEETLMKIINNDANEIKTIINKLYNT